jgi:1-deoxy-D-xylulose-5-phosphate reductoisomerase
MRRGGSASIALNAANEIAVDAFLQKKIAFTSIAEIIENVLGESSITDVNTLDDILAADRAAREITQTHLHDLLTV